MGKVPGPSLLGFLTIRANFLLKKTDGIWRNVLGGVQTGNLELKILSPEVRVRGTPVCGK